MPFSGSTFRRRNSELPDGRDGGRGETRKKGTHYSQRGSGFSRFFRTVSLFFEAIDHMTTTRGKH